MHMQDMRTKHSSIYEPARSFFTAKTKRILPHRIKVISRRWLRISRLLTQISPRYKKEIIPFYISLSRNLFRSNRQVRAWQDPVLHFDGDVAVRGVGYFTVRAYSDDLWHAFPGREPAIFHAVESYLTEGDVFIDAGANIGFYTVLASRLVGPSGKVVAVEMMPPTAELLARHVTMNACHNVRTVAAALVPGPERTVAAQFVDGKFGMASVARDAEAVGGRHVEVKAVRLGDILSEVDEVALMKMDLEGAEEGALRGGLDQLHKIRRIIFESRDGASACDELLESQGFEIRALDRANRIAERRDVSA